jgi:hypothetical protein
VATILLATPFPRSGAFVIPVSIPYDGWTTFKDRITAQILP